MGWDLFRRTVRLAMESKPASSDIVADVIARQYDFTMRTPPSGDYLSKNFVVKGNTELFSAYLKGVFRSQSLSSSHLGIFDKIAQGFPTYWVGAQLSTFSLPPLPPPGLSLPNIAVTANFVVNAGSVTPIPFPYGTPLTTEGFIEQIIIRARLHLPTISGQMVVVAQSPTIPPVPTPGILIWQGYKV